MRGREEAGSIRHKMQRYEGDGYQDEAREAMRRRGQAGTTRTQTCWSVVRVHTGHCTKGSTDCVLHTMKRHPVHHRIRHDCRLQIVQRAHCALHNPAGQEWTKWAVLGAGGASGCAAGCEPEVPAGQWPPTSCCSNTFQLVDNVRVKGVELCCGEDSPVCLGARRVYFGKRKEDTLYWGKTLHCQTAM